MTASKGRLKFSAEDIERHLQNGVDLRQVNSLTEYLDILAAEDETSAQASLGQSTSQKRSNSNQISH